MRKLGKGGYGTVYAVIKDDKEIAVKEVKISKNGISNLLELSIMATYTHPSLNRALSIEIKDDKLWIYQDLARFDLAAYIDKNGAIPEDLTKQWAHSIAFGLQFLHKERIVHGDIKPQNVLIYDNNTVRLNDFGCSLLLGKRELIKLSGTIQYNSPEMLINKIVSYSGDIWSLGCVIYEMLTGKKLIPRIEKTEICREIKTAKSIQQWRETRGDIIKEEERLPSHTCPPVNFILSGEPAELIDAMTKYSQIDRPNIQDVLIDKWLKGLTKPRGIQIECEYISEEDLEVGISDVESYFARVGLDVQDPLFSKIVEIYTLSSMNKTIDIESSIQIVAKLYNLEINGFKPMTGRKELVETELYICSSNRYVLHKMSRHNLSVDIGTNI